MKKLILMLLVPLILILASCSASMSYQLTEDNNINTVYYADITSSGINISSYADSLKKYWEQMGFTVETGGTGEEHSVTGKKTSGYESGVSAAGAFSSILSDKNSIFTNIKFTYTPSFFKDSYSLTASVSLDGVIRQSEDESIPEAEAGSLLKQAQSADYTLSIQLPGNIISTNADTQESGVCSWNLKYGESRDISLQTEREFKEHTDKYTGLQNSLKNDNLILIICSAAGGAALIGIILTFAIRKSRKSKDTKNQP